MAMLQLFLEKDKVKSLLSLPSNLRIPPKKIKNFFCIIVFIHYEINDLSVEKKNFLNRNNKVKYTVFA